MSGVGSLHDIRVVEFGGMETLYAGKLLAEQGAHVQLLEPPGGHPSRSAFPLVELPDQRFSATFAYLNASKRLGRLPAREESWRSLYANADVVLVGGRPVDIRRAGFDLDAARAANPAAIITTVTPFGWHGPYADLQATDLTLQAMGGLMTMGGYFDGRPLRPPAGQAYVAASLFAAIATLAQISSRDVNGVGEHIDVSVQESVAMALENLAQFYDLEGRVRTRHGGSNEQAARGIYPCRDGYVCLMAGVRAESKFWFALVDWLEEANVDGASSLRDDRWLEREFLESPQAEEHFRSIFGPFCMARDRDELYAQARRRGIPMTPVNDMSQLLTNEQLDARGFWYPVLGGRGRVPGPPYRMAATPWLGGDVAVMPAHPAPDHEDDGRS